MSHLYHDIMTKKKILITGITGQDGYNMIKWLLKHHGYDTYDIYGGYVNPNKIDKDDGDDIFHYIKFKLDLYLVFFHLKMNQYHHYH